MTTDQWAALAQENRRLRKILAECGNAAGGRVTPECSLDFMAHIPAEIRLRLGRSTAAAQTSDARDAAKWRAIDVPELHDFGVALEREAAHQRKRWGTDHDAGKAPEDWFWLIGYLAGKALHSHKAGDVDKALHHTITAAAALANWHAAIVGKTNMRPGIDGDAAIAASGEGSANG